MKSRLLSDEYPNSIVVYIHNSDHSYINREFEYIHEFEIKCLEQFNICKSLYESLTIWEKDEVINYWKERCDWYFEEEVTFSPDNIKKFDLLTFYEIESNDYRYNELENTDPYPTFYRNYYILKFRKLLINFFFFEEYSNLKSLEIVNYVKPEFNPYEFLDLEMPVGVFPNTKNKDGLPGVSQKFKGHLFWQISRAMDSLSNESGKIFKELFPEGKTPEEMVDILGKNARIDSVFNAKWIKVQSINNRVDSLEKERFKIINQINRDIDYFSKLHPEENFQIK